MMNRREHIEHHNALLYTIYTSDMLSYRNALWCLTLNV